MLSPFRCNLFLLGGLKPKLLYLEFHVDFALREHMALTHVIFCREKTPKMHRCTGCRCGSYPNYKLLKINQEINKRTSPNRVELI